MASNKATPSFKRKLLATAVISCFAVGTVEANPNGATVAHGTATFNTSGSTLTVTNTPNAIINWANFSIDSGETVRFVQQSSASAVLNRVTSSNPSQILGALQSNGKVFLVNPNGILFGANAQINVNGLVASSLNITDSDFLNGKLKFNADRATPGAVTNAGQITTPAGGFVYLLAPNVENSGVITTPSGEAILAAGNSIEIVDSVDPSQRVVVSTTSQDINLSQLMTQSNGNIFTVLNSGKVSANTAVQDQTGKIYFKSAGNILTTATSVQEVNGDLNADGGHIQAFADGGGFYQGTFSANGKNGGFIETSGHYLNVEGINISAKALDGNAGTWLLDPTDVTIIHATTANDTNLYGGFSTYQPQAGSSNTIISDFTLNNAINSSTNVTLTTQPFSGTGTANGDITFAGDVVLSKDSGATFSTTLALSAYRDIVFAGTGTNSIVNNSTSQNLIVTLESGTGGSGGIRNLAGSTLTLNSAGGGGSMVVQVQNGKTWTNNGTTNILGASQIHLFDGTTPATYVNNGIVNITNNTSGFAFYSRSSNQDGIINNNGTFKVVGGTSLEAVFNNGAAGLLDVSGGTLSMQNAGTIKGTVNIGSGSTVWLSENHLVSHILDNTTINGPGTLQAASAATALQMVGTITLNGAVLDIPFTVSAPTGVAFTSTSAINLTNFNISAASGNVSATSSAGVSLNNVGITASSGSVTLNGSTLSLNAATINSAQQTLSASSGISLVNSTLNTSGNMQISTPGALTIDGSTLTSNGTLSFTGGTTKIQNASSLSSNIMFGKSTGDMNLNGGSSLTAQSEMTLTTTGHLSLNNSSFIKVVSPNTLFFNFPALFANGWSVDGIANAYGTAGNGSYIIVNNAVPILGSDFFVTYASSTPSTMGVIYNTPSNALTPSDPVPTGITSSLPTIGDFFPTGPTNPPDLNRDETPQQCS
jgi:filamentous hemagglutinin family protein